MLGDASRGTCIRLLVCACKAGNSLLFSGIGALPAILLAVWSCQAKCRCTSARGFALALPAHCSNHPEIPSILGGVPALISKRHQPLSACGARVRGSSSRLNCPSAVSPPQRTGECSPPPPPFLCCEGGGCEASVWERV